MSASREKKNRQNKPVVTPAEAPKKGMSKAAKRAIGVVVAIVLIAVVVFFAMVSGGFFQKHTTAAVVNGHKLSPVMLNYYYVSSYQELQSYLGTMMDGETPLSEMEFSGEEFDTWEDYIIDYAASVAANTYALYDEAIANGHVLSDAGKTQIESELNMYEIYANMYGYGSANAMLAYQFGTGATEKSYEEFLTVKTIAAEYGSKIQSEFTYSDDEIAAYYAENYDQFNYATFRAFNITPATLGEEDGEIGTKACELAAQELVKAGEKGELDFVNYAVSLLPEDQAASYDADTATLYEDYAFSYCSAEYRDWIADEARQEGDTTYVSNGDGGFYALYFIRHDDHSFQLPNVRHILISFTDTTSEEAKAATAEEAQNVLDEYLAGEQSEEAFAELAKTYSNDNADEGGLYENIAPGTMVEAFDAWIYDESRQVGDTDIVETEYGHHIMYFCGYGKTYQDYEVENAMRSADYMEWSDSIIADATHTVNESAKRYMINL